jgi:hypothetical protein
VLHVHLVQHNLHLDKLNVLHVLLERLTLLQDKLNVLIVHLVHSVMELVLSAVLHVQLVHTKIKTVNLHAYLVQSVNSKEMLVRNNVLCAQLVQWLPTQDQSVVTPVTLALHKINPARVFVLHVQLVVPHLYQVKLNVVNVQLGQLKT